MLNAILRATMTRPDGSGVTLYRTPAGFAAGPTPHGEIEVKFGRPSPRDNADPETITLTLDQPAGTPTRVEYDALVVVTLQIGTRTATLARGWVAGWTRETVGKKRPRDRYAIQLTDVTGRAAGWKLGDGMRPVEYDVVRRNRVNVVTGQQFASPMLSALRYVGPRDIDNRTALEALEYTVKPLIAHLLPTTDGLQVFTAGRNQLVDGLVVEPRDGIGLDAVEVPSSAIGDAGDALNRSGRLTLIAIESPTWAAGSGPGDPPIVTAPATTTHKRAAYLGPTSEFRKSTDVLLDSTDTRSYQGVLAASTERASIALAPSRLVLDRIAPAVLIQLLDLNTRLPTPIYITGQIRRHGVDPVVFISAGRIVARGGKLVRFDVTLSPGAPAGVRSLTWNDFRINLKWKPTPTTLRGYQFGELRGPAGPSQRVLTFGLARVFRITIDREL